MPIAHKYQSEGRSATAGQALDLTILGVGDKGTIEMIVGVSRPPFGLAAVLLSGFDVADISAAYTRSNGTSPLRKSSM
jgi:hypothetical protein